MKKWGFIVLVILIVLGCRKDPIAWNIDALVPILKTKMTLQQAFPEEFISVADNGELEITYNGNLITLELDSALQVPDTSVADTFTLPFGSITFPGGYEFLTDSNYTRYNFGGAELTHLFVSKGFLEFEIISKIDGPTVFEYSFPTMKKNGQALFIKENIPGAIGGNPGTLTKSIDISGYEISLTGINNDNFNVLASKYKAYIDSNSVPIVVNAGDFFIASNTITQLQPEYIRGSFGSENTNQKETNEPLDIFSNVKSGLLTLEEASMDFTIKNEAGMDLTVTVNEISGWNNANQTRVALASPLSNNPININRATETNGIYSAPKASTHLTELNSENSNLADFIANLPHALSYDFEINLNPLGNVSAGNDFIYNNTGVEINLDAEIPLNFNASNLVLIDTSDFEIDSTSQEDVNQIIGGNLNVYSENWYPFDLYLQFYLLDEQNNILDSIFTQTAKINGGIPIFGVVDDPQISLIEAPLSQERANLLYQTTRIITKARVNSTAENNNRIFDYYFLETKIVGDFEYQVSIK